MSRVPEYVWVSKLTGNIVAEDGFVPTDGEYWERCRLAPAPPADGEKLPRRFRWKGCFGVYAESPKHGGAKVIHPCLGRIELIVGGMCDNWLSDHADEIEWIDT